MSLTTRGLFTVDMESHRSGCKRTFHLTPSRACSGSQIDFSWGRFEAASPADELHIPLQTSETR